MGYIRLGDGSMFDPMGNDPIPSRWVFTRSLSMISRYTGHTCRPYAVGEHSIILARSKEVSSRGLSRAAALHDFSESIFNDLARPVKAELPEYCEAETRLQRRIFDRWDEPWANMEALKEFDTRICVDEMTVLFGQVQTWAEPLGVYIPTQGPAWTHIYAEFEALCSELEIY